MKLTLLYLVPGLALAAPETLHASILLGAGGGSLSGSAEGGIALMIFYAVLAIGVSFLCSMLEASLLSLPPSYIRAQAEAGSRIGKKLLSMKMNIDRPLAAILTLNTVAHTVGAAGVGAQAAVVWDSNAVGLASAIMTLLILIFSEIIPKTLGAVLAKQLTGFTAITTQAMIVLCYPLILSLEWIHRAMGMKRRAEAISRAELIAALGLGQESGALDRHESRILTNLIALENLKVSAILTPRTVVFTLPADMTVREVMENHHTLHFARIPIIEGSFDNVLGYVTRYELQKAFATDRQNVVLRELNKPLEVIPEVVSVSNALEYMLQKRLHIALAVNEYGGAEGLVTLEDILESLLGVEIVDESDPVTDMQQLAKRLQARRAERWAEEA